MSRPLRQAQGRPYLSVVIPTYMAQEMIERTVRAVFEHIARRGWEAEVIVTTTREGDRTHQVLAELSDEHENLRIVDTTGASLKGESIKQGMAVARGEYRCFIDADNGVSFDQVDEALRLGEDFDVVMGSRYLPGGESGDRSLARILLSRGGNLLFRLVLGLGYTDTRAPMKLYRAEAAERLFPKLRIRSFGFDTELLFLAERLGMRITEYPVRWDPGDKSTVHFWRDTVVSIWELFQVRYWWLTGRYR